MQCYVINLADAGVRLARMQREFRRIGLEFIRVDAVNGKLAGSGGEPIPENRSRDWSPGELGCAASHVKVWRLIADGSDPYGAVFEDDVHISSVLPAVLREIPALDCDIVKLETVLSLARLGNVDITRIEGVALRPLEGMHTSTGAYVLSRAAAKRLVENINLLDAPVDHVLFDPRHPLGRTFKVLQCVPAVAIQDSFLPQDAQLGGFIGSQMFDRPRFDDVPEKRAVTKAILTAPFRAIRRAWLAMTTKTMVVPYAADIARDRPPT